MTIALKMTGTACPVFLEEEVEVVSFGIENLIGEDIDHIAQSLLQSLILPYTVEIGIWFNDMQVGILRLRIVGI